MRNSLVLLAALVLPASGQEFSIHMAPPVNAVERDGITGAGNLTAAGSQLILTYPNHPDNFGGSAGTGTAISSDGGKTWAAGQDDWPIPKTVDLWTAQLRNGDLLAFGLRSLPDPKSRDANPPPTPAPDAYGLAVSKDRGKTWNVGNALIQKPEEIGIIARSLTRILEDKDGTLSMPAYAWGRGGTRALWLQSTDRGQNWTVLSSIVTAAEIVKSGNPVTSPWLESQVAKTKDGSLRAVVRTGSSAQSALVTTRSTDGGKTWAAVEPILSGPEKSKIGGKMPSLTLLPNGLLVLLTAHSNNHCRLYISTDGNGETWSPGQIVTSQSGGNATMAQSGPDEVITITPSNRRLDAWRIAVSPGTVKRASLPAPTEVSATKGRVTWKGSGAASYQVTPILLEAAEAQILPCIPIRTEKPEVDLSRVLLIGGKYRVEVAAIHPTGISASASSPEFIAGR